MKTHERSRAIRLAPDEPPRRSWVHPRPGDGHVARRAGRHARAGAPLAGAEQRARRAIVADQRRRPRFQCAAVGDPPAKPAASQELPALDRLFVTIAALDDTLGPVERIKSIYPRYFDFGRFAGPDGLLVIRFRDGTPYQAEDLFYDPAAPAHFVARCSRPGAGPTPGICLLERRLAEAADITVRFPRDWLVDWRRLSAEIDRLIA